MGLVAVSSRARSPRRINRAPPKSGSPNSAYSPPEERADLAEQAEEAKARIERGDQHYVAVGQGRRIDFERRAIDLWGRVQEALDRGRDG